MILTHRAFKAPSHAHRPAPRITYIHLLIHLPTTTHPPFTLFLSSKNLHDTNSPTSPYQPNDYLLLEQFCEHLRLIDSTPASRVSQTRHSTPVIVSPHTIPEDEQLIRAPTHELASFSLAFHPWKQPAQIFATRPRISYPHSASTAFSCLAGSCPLADIATPCLPV